MNGIHFTLELRHAFKLNDKLTCISKILVTRSPELLYPTPSSLSIVSISSIDGSMLRPENLSRPYDYPACVPPETIISEDLR